MLNSVSIALVVERLFRDYHSFGQNSEYAGEILQDLGMLLEPRKWPHAEDPKNIVLRLVEYGETVVEVSRLGYEAAKIDGEVGDFIDCYASNIETITKIVEQSGHSYDPWGL